MPSAIDYILPCSNKFHAQRDFKRLDCGKKAGTVILTALAALLSLGLAGTAVFRLLVGHFSQTVTNKDTKSTVQKIRRAGEPFLKKGPTPIHSPVKTVYVMPRYTEEDLLYTDSEEVTEDLTSAEQTSEGSGEFVADPAEAQSNSRKRVRFLAGCLNKLNDLLAPDNKKCGISMDNGDCFYDSFAIKLRELGYEATAKQMREEVCREAQRIHLENPKVNWIRAELEQENDFDYEKASENIGNAIVQKYSYEEFLESVQFSAEESLSKGKILIWGNEAIDGRILCSLYEVNLRVLEVGYMPHFEPSDRDAYYKNDQKDWIINNSEFPFTIELGLIPDHFVPILSKE